MVTWKHQKPKSTFQTNSSSLINWAIALFQIYFRALCNIISHRTIAEATIEVLRGPAYGHELQALFGTFHKKSSYLAQYQTAHTSHYEVLTRCEPPQSNVQSNIWMRRSYEHTDPYQSSTNVKRSANDWKTWLLQTLDGAASKLPCNIDLIKVF